MTESQEPKPKVFSIPARQTGWDRDVRAIIVALIRDRQGIISLETAKRAVLLADEIERARTDRQTYGVKP